MRASRVIAEEPESDAEDELDLFEHIPGLEEARSVAKLSDTNIVTVYDCAVEGSSAYVIMEYVEGKTLAQIIDEVDDDITLDVVAAVFSAVSHALEVAHGEHTLHLDIKPENVIVNGKGQAKVADFGLAALMDATGSGTTGGGTIGYMPLEQMRQEPLDVRTDEWALASLTYEMLTGSNPFFADDLDAAEEAIEEAELVLPSLCWDELDAEADEVMFAALDPDMDERYEDVAAFAAALSPYLGNAKKGKRVLADIVNGKMEEPAAEEPERVWEPLPPLVDRLGLRGAAIVGRIVAAAAVALLAAAGMANLHLTPGSAMGLATDAPIAYGVVIAVCALVAAIRPSIGVLFGYGAFVVGLAGAGAWVPAVLLTAATGAWWYFVGRRGTAQAVSALMQPLFGSVGFCGGLAGDVRRAAAGAAIGRHGGLRLRERPHHGRLRLGRPHELGRGHAPRLLEQPGGRVPGGGVAAGHLGHRRKLDRRCGPLQPLVRARHPRLRHRRFGGGSRGAHARRVRGGPSRFLRRLVAARSGGAARSAGARRSRHLGRGYEHSRSRPLGRRRMVCGRREVDHFPAGHSILTAPMTNPPAAARAA
ncbi:MAG: protein kinase domain-containing protein [Adlercreutzia equolifaciens]